MVRWRAASCMACSMPFTHSLSRYLHKANILNTESEARRGNTFSITIILCIIHRVQDIAVKINKKRRHLIPVWFAWVSRNLPRSRACHAGPGPPGQSSIETGLRDRWTCERIDHTWAFPLHVYLYKNYNPNYKWEITTIRTHHDLEDQGVMSHNVTYLW
jgi:hypothetical protein